MRRLLISLIAFTHLTSCAAFLDTFRDQGPSPDDKDGDGIENHEDRCMDTPGLATLKGCPDVNENGVADVDERGVISIVHSLAELQEFLQRNDGDALVLFSSRWCGPCTVVERFWKQRGDDGLAVPVVLWHDETDEHWTFTPDFEGAYRTLTGQHEMSLPTCVVVKGATTWPPSNNVRIKIGDDIERCTDPMAKFLADGP